MFSLLSICHVLHPMKLEEGILSLLSDKYQDKQLKMQRGFVFSFISCISGPNAQLTQVHKVTKIHENYFSFVEISSYFGVYII